ncbi:MAG: hypothetical protein HY080_06590 [Gammaproteobacteria bacterium]|nr:hypothetical protein [Gammaproteobacteria bacterium]
MSRWHGYFTVTLSGIVFILLGCSTPLINDTPKTLALIPGEASIIAIHVPLAQLAFPPSERLTTGSVLMFSPIEFRSDKDRYNIDSVSLPLGRYVALRHSEEGLLANLPAHEVTSFEVHYKAHYPNLAQAQRDFPKLTADRFSSRVKDGKSIIQVEQWQMRLSMVVSHDRQAFRVLLDNIEYIPPAEPPNLNMNPDDAPVVEVPKRLPVVVAFSYRHPDSDTESLIQQNVIYEFIVATENGVFHGAPQITGWLPLNKHADTQPYSVSVVVAEVHAHEEQFYKKIFDFVKTVRGVL